MQYMKCNFALIDVGLAINHCQDWFMHNRKDCKWNIHTSWSTHINSCFYVGEEQETA